MPHIRVALVCPNDELRMVAARSFDAAPSDWAVTLHRDPPADADVVVAVGCEVPDAVPFDPRRPALVLERVRARLAITDHRVVEVVGASGGCGATNLAIHLAASASGGSCVLAASGGPLAHRLGVDPDTVTSKPLPVAGGFKVASAGEADIGPVLTGLSDRFRSIVVDGGHYAFGGVGDNHACVLVLSPTVPSARAGAELLAAFSDLPWAVVSNRLGPGGETGTAELQRILGRRITLELPCSRGLRDAEGEARLVSRWSLWRRRVERLARALELR